MNTTTPRPTPETDAESINGAHHPQFVFSDFARELERERDEMREELQQWKMLCAWGGTPEHIDQFIKGQQSRIHQAQDIEETCQQLERERDEAREQLQAMREVIAAAEKCRHWHDCSYNEDTGKTEGVIISAESFWSLQNALTKLQTLLP